MKKTIKILLCLTGAVILVAAIGVTISAIDVGVASSADGMTVEPMNASLYGGTVQERVDKETQKLEKKLEEKLGEELQKLFKIN